MVYSKRPFAGPGTVLAYLSRYTHRVAIGNGRILALDDCAGSISFAYKDYAHQSRPKTMSLTLAEFLRRFCLHILPPRFVRLRHYGLLANRGRTRRIDAARAFLGNPGPADTTASPPRERPAPQATAAPICPHCGSSRLIFLLRRMGPHPASRPTAHDSS